MYGIVPGAWGHTTLYIYEHFLQGPILSLDTRQTFTQQFKNITT